MQLQSREAEVDPQYGDLDLWSRLDLPEVDRLEVRRDPKVRT